MKLYEYNEAIANFAFQIDEETGEVLNGEEFEALQIGRKEKILATGLKIKDLESDNKAIDDEIKRLQAWRDTGKNEIAWLKDYLARMLEDGEKISEPNLKIGWRTSEALGVTDESALIEWLKKNRPEGLTFKEPTVNKTAVKGLIKQGVKIPMAKIEQRNNIQIK